MNKVIYRPIDSDFYQVEEYTIDLRSGVQKPTGRRLRLVETCKPESDKYELFLKRAQRDGRVIVFNPDNCIPGAYELIE